jgi:hypothetical protein
LKVETRRAASLQGEEVNALCAVKPLPRQGEKVKAVMGWRCFAAGQHIPGGM